MLLVFALATHSILPAQVAMPAKIALLPVAQTPQDDGGGLDLESAPATEVEAREPASPLASPGSVGLVVLMLVAIGFAWWWGTKARGEPARVSLDAAPLAAKLTWTFVLVIYGITHVVAAITVYLDTRVLYSSAAEYFYYMKAARLSGLSHAHLMSIATMDGIAGMLFALSRPTSGFAVATVAAAFVGIIGDIASWWLTKYWGGAFELVSMVTGVLFGGAFLVMMLAVLYSTWWPRASLRRRNA